MPTIYSFDVFDTALLRTLAYPADIFRIVATAIAESEGMSAPELFVEEFVSARVSAERTARRRASPREDCSLDDIWRELRALLPDLPGSASSSLEVQAEFDSIVANPNLAGRISALRKAGHRVIFISDIYYSHQTVFELLQGAGLTTSMDDVYVSSEVGLLKATGNLFDHVAEREGISPRDLVHVGDNIESDGRAARRRGVKATVYHASRLNNAEQTVIAAYGGNLTGSRLAAAMRFFRLKSRSDGRGSLVPTFLGPLSVLLAAWTLRQASQRNVGRVYFIARDGHIPWRAAMKIAAAFPDVESRYAQLSRLSLIASVPRLGEFGVCWIERSWADLPIGEIVSLVGHDWDAVEEALRPHLPRATRAYVLRGSEEIRTFVSVLDAIPDGPARQERSAAAIAYLRDAGLMDASPFMIFDVGWYLNLQAALKAVLDQHCTSGFRGGLYLGLSIGRVGEAMAGHARALMYEIPHASDLPAGRNLFFDRRILVEHLVGLAPHGSAKGYTKADDGGVRVIEGPIDDARRDLVRRISDDVAEFAELISPFAAELGDEEVTARAIDALARHYFTHPGSYDLGQLGQLEVESDTGMKRRMSLGEPWDTRSILLKCIPYRLRARLGLSHGPTLWPEASVASSGPAARWALGMLRGVRQPIARLIRG